MIIAAPLLLLGLTLLLMRSPMVGRIVASQVREATGGELTARHAVITLNGQLLVSDLKLRVPGMDGEAGEVLSASQAIADIDWWGLPPLKWFAGASHGRGPKGSQSALTVLRLTAPIFRLSQSIDDDSLNIAALRPRSSGEGTAQLPRIDVIDGQIEFTEHSPSRGTFNRLNTLAVGGALLPGEPGRTAGDGTPGTPAPTFKVRLQETGRAPSIGGEQRGLILDGEVDLAANTVSLRLFHLSLDAWPADSVPTKFREQWRRLAVQGQIEQTSLAYSSQAGVNVTVTVKDVSIVVPVPADKPTDEDGYLSLSNVDGQIGLSSRGLRADLTGRLEQQPGQSHVVLITRGLELTSGFHCEISGRGLNVSRNPEFLPYVPRTVRQYLDWFGGPTADVDAQVVIERGDPVNGQAAELTVPDGQLTFRNGRAAFHKFPYPFHDMAGEVRFDDQTIRMVKITGVGPSGSPLTASGTITPISENAQVDVKIDVADVPVDDDLLAVMRPSYRRLTEVIFSRDRWRSLVDAGLVREPGQPAPPAAGQAAAPPEFAFAGMAQIHVRIRRPPGDQVEWATDVGVSFDRAGLVPEPFPFPIIARDLRFNIHDDRAVLEGGTFTGLRGGEAKVEASIVFGRDETEPAEPDVRITALNVPVDELLLNAVPGEAAGSDAAITGADRGPMSLDAKAILRRLDLRGEVDCRVALTGPADRRPAPEPDLIGPIDELPVHYSVLVELDQLTAAPAHEAGDSAAPAPGLCVRELTGAINVTPTGVEIRGLRAQLGRLGAGDEAPVVDAAAAIPRWQRREQFASAEPAGELEIDLASETPGSGVLGELHAKVGVRDLELIDPVEDFVAVFSPSSGRFLRQLRATRAPTGRMNASVTLDAPKGGPERPMQIGVELGSTDALSIHALGGELALQAPSGGVHITLIDRPAPAVTGPRLRFDSLSAGLRFNDEQAGQFRLTGEFTAGEGDRAVRGPADLSCELSDWRFEGGLTESILREFGGADLVEGYQRYAPQGRFDATLGLAGEGAEGKGAGGVGEVAVNGSISPHTLRIVRRGVPIDFTEVGGRITFNSPAPTGTTPPLAASNVPRTLRGTLDDVRVSTTAWTISGSADWVFSGDGVVGRGGVDLDAALAATITRIDDPLRALLPEEVGRAVDGIGLKFDESLRLTDGRLRANFAGPSGEGDAAARDAEPTVDFQCELEFGGLSADVGVDAVPIREASGRATIGVHTGAPADGAAQAVTPKPLVESQLRLDSLRLAGLSLTDARARVVEVEPGHVQLLDAVASCHRGRVFADGDVRWHPSPAAPELPAAGSHPAGAAGASPRVDYRITAMMAGVNFAPLLDDLSRSGIGAVDGKSARVIAPASDSGSSDATRGTVDARISAAGVAGDRESRRGRGAIRIANGDVIRLPLIVPLMQMSNLLLPFGDRLNFLRATFYLDGQTAVFDDIRLLSDTISIVGAGSVSTPDLAVDMRFNTRSNRRLPIWSDLFEALRNELVSTTVTGTVDKPVIRSETLPATRRLLGGMVSPGAAAAQNRTDSGSGPLSGVELDRVRQRGVEFAPMTAAGGQ